MKFNLDHYNDDEKTKLLFSADAVRPTSQTLSQGNLTQEQRIQARLKEIEDSMEFHVALLGGPGTGKTSLLRKITKNYTDDINEDEN